MEPRDEQARKVEAPRALIFDVDGTLYAGGPVRRGMLLRLVTGHLLRPLAGVRVIRGLSAFRRAQEALRGREPSVDLDAEQVGAAATHSGLPAHEISGWVRHWMEESPLDLVARARRPGLVQLLERARAAGVRLGVLSDYPPRPKLEALGVAGFFDAVHWAQERAVGVFKPDPRGLHALLAELEVAPEEAVYIGDRADVDTPVARAAGVACVLVGSEGEPNLDAVSRRLFG